MLLKYHRLTLEVEPEDVLLTSWITVGVSTRFDCGTGPAQITSENQVELGQWNTLTVHRNDWNGWIQLNDGPQAKGRSKVSIYRSRTSSSNNPNVTSQILQYLKNS